MENNEILIWGNESFFFINFQFLNVITIKLYCLEKYLLQGKFFNSSQSKIISNHGSFSILFFLKSTNFLEIKPLTEKFVYFVNSNTIIIRNQSINSVKFFGKKNSILIGNKSHFINVLNGSCFKFVGLFPIENVIPTEIILKKKFILIESSSHEIYIYNLVSSSMLEKRL